MPASPSRCSGGLERAGHLGANVGPCVAVYGSLETILFLEEARKRGVEVRSTELARVGGWLAPLMLVAGGAALWLVLG
jgi:Na+/H+ antiporter NhaD/arsenite permease-like protein